MGTARQVRQRDAALEKARWVRRARRELREALKDEKLDGYALIAGDIPQWEDVVKGMRLEVALRMLPGVGRVTADDAIAELQLDRNDELGALSFERRAELSRWIREVVDGVPSA